MKKRVEPEVMKAAYVCPYCEVHAQQLWQAVVVGTGEYSRHPKEDVHKLGAEEGLGLKEGTHRIIGPQRTGMWVGLCTNWDCRKETLWVGGEMVVPRRKTGPVAHEDMPEEVRKLYEEAREIAEASPGAAAAVLRKAAEKLCNDLVGEEIYFHDAVKKLYEDRRIHTRTKETLDKVRKVGNKGAHPSEAIDFNERRDVPPWLMMMINMIVEETITVPQHQEEVWNSLPEEVKAGKRKK